MSYLEKILNNTLASIDISINPHKYDGIPIEQYINPRNVTKNDLEKIINLDTYVYVEIHFKGEYRPLEAISYSIEKAIQRALNK